MSNRFSSKELYSGDSNPSLANTELVSNHVPTCVGLPKTASGNPRPHDQSRRRGHTSPTESQSAGRMVHLRRSYQGSGMSEGAISLLMASWRGSTTIPPGGYGNAGALAMAPVQFLPL